MESAGRAQAARDRVPRIDEYGFERPEDFDYAAYEEFFSAYLAILTRRAIKWSRLLKGGGGIQKSMTHMNRTFPDNVRFRKGSDPCLQRTLYNVLLAYGHHNRGVGYCQGMNFIAGYLILVTRSEEESFWLLDALVGRILPDYYSPSMLGLKTDQEVLGELVRTKLPAVAALMDSHGLLWTLVVSRWFICLFVDVLPVETVLRVWDCLFNEGSKIIFRVALTLIKQHQALILEATSVPDICEKFKEITGGSFVTECHTFMQSAHRRPRPASELLRAVRTNRAHTRRAKAKSGLLCSNGHRQQSEEGTHRTGETVQTTSAKGSTSRHTEATAQQGAKELHLKMGRADFPGGAVVESPPASAGDTGSSPGPGRSHVPRSS
ncbi:growth hormone-regulated TBC protein 1 isoform X3 [Physeter macrocephalus]|uniref:Growth hormone-regulated TBC protein 1 n=1 Tax=Physeter macrocephalus TaxID=9755 RepID=A0A9W2X283_PHYMC|nr:growth hormone-regulated TBC protein 1 isoform X3 [Physeter catodon]